MRLWRFPEVSSYFSKGDQMKSIQMLRVIVGVVALVGGFHFDPASAFAQAGSDNVAAPTPITGTGYFQFDLTTATMSQQGYMPNCVPANPLAPSGMADNDLWWCWTATCDGLVRVSTCAGTGADTVLAIYPGQLDCQSPNVSSPMCCNNNSCASLQSNFTCEVTCGLRYLIQVGRIPGGLTGSGDILIECVSAPCAPPEPFNCNCCGGRPPIVDAVSTSLPTPFVPGAVAVATNSDAVDTSKAVWLMELGGQPSAPVGSNWNTGRYSHPTWTMKNLGDVFGVTLDRSGNIFYDAFFNKKNTFKYLKTFNLIDRFNLHKIWYGQLN